MFTNLAGWLKKGESVASFVHKDDESSIEEILSYMPEHCGRVVKEDPGSDYDP